MGWLLHTQNAAEVPHTGFVFAVESKKGCATKLTFCDTSFSIHTADLLTSVAITGCDSGVSLFSIIWSSMVLDLVEIVMR